jgi:hypothetical protein
MPNHDPMPNHYFIAHYHDPMPNHNAVSNHHIVAYYHNSMPNNNAINMLLLHMRRWLGCESSMQQPGLPRRRLHKRTVLSGSNYYPLPNYNIVAYNHHSMPNHNPMPNHHFVAHYHDPMSNYHALPDYVFRSCRAVHDRGKCGKALLVGRRGCHPEWAAREDVHRGVGSTYRLCGTLHLCGYRCLQETH